jgi:hypothetical protein
MDDDLPSDSSDVENDAFTDGYQKWCEAGRQPNLYRPLEFWSTRIKSRPTLVPHAWLETSVP